MLDYVIEHIFFYGTLWTGSGDSTIDAVVRRHGRRVGRAYVHGRLYDLGNCPAVMPAVNRQDRVFGILCRLIDADAALRKLDRYEDYDATRPERSEYVRRAAPVCVLNRRRVIDAWIYFYNSELPVMRRIRHGDYRRYLTAQTASRAAASASG